MDQNTPINFNIEEVKKAVLRKFPLVADSFSGTNFIENNNLQTACTDGEDIYYNLNLNNRQVL